MQSFGQDYSKDKHDQADAVSTPYVLGVAAHRKKFIYSVVHFLGTTQLFADPARAFFTLQHLAAYAGHQYGEKQQLVTQNHHQ